MRVGVAPSVLGDRELVPLRREWASRLAPLLAAGGNRHLFAWNPDHLEAAIDLLEAMPYSSTAVVLRAGVPEGVVAAPLGSPQHLTAQHVALMQDPAEGAPGVVLHLARLFWAHPLERVYAHVPDIEDARPIVDMYREAGFVVEGRLPRHHLDGEQRFDVVALGILRREAEAVIAERAPELAW